MIIMWTVDVSSKQEEKGKVRSLFEALGGSDPLQTISHEWKKRSISGTQSCLKADHVVIFGLLKTGFSIFQFAVWSKACCGLKMKCVDFLWMHFSDNSTNNTDFMLYKQTKGVAQRSNVSSSWFCNIKGNLPKLALTFPDLFFYEKADFFLSRPLPQALGTF